MCMFNSVNNGCVVCAADLQACVFLCAPLPSTFGGFGVIKQDDETRPLKRHPVCRLQLHTGRIKSRRTVSPRFWHRTKVQFSGRDSGAGDDNTCVFGILSTWLQRKKKKQSSRNLKPSLCRILLGTEVQQLAKFRVQQWMIRAPHFPPSGNLTSTSALISASFQSNHEAWLIRFLTCTHKSEQKRKSVGNHCMSELIDQCALRQHYISGQTYRLQSTNISR